MTLATRYGRFVVRRRRFLLVLSAALLALAGVGFTALGDRVQLEAFVAPDSEAHQGKQLLEDRFGVGSPNLVVAITARAGTVDDAAVAGRARALAGRLEREPGVAQVTSYWTSPRGAGLRSADARTGLVLVRIVGDGLEIDETVRRLEDDVLRGDETVTVRAGGEARFIMDATDITKEEITKAELATGPLTLAALLVIFGSIAAACIPLGIAAFALLGTGGGLYLLSYATPVSTYALYMTSILALGLAVDYALFIVTRFREELAAHGDVETAVVNTLATAGRTVLFSAIAVGVALAGALLLPLDFMRSLGWAGIGTAVTAGFGALVVLPALLAQLGPGVNAGTVWRRSVRVGDGRGRWYRTARRIMRFPVQVATVATVGFLAAGLPLLQLNGGMTDDRNFGRNAESRVVGDLLRDQFPDRVSAPLFAVVPDGGGDDAVLEEYGRALAAVDGVTSVQRGGAAGSARWLAISTDREPLSDAAAAQVEALRAVPAPFDEVLFTGEAANLRDITDLIIDAVPRMVAFVLFVAFVAMVAQFGSVLLAALAVLMTGLSLSALYGISVLVFQEGLGSDLLGFTSTGSTYLVVPIAIFCLAFGLGMDYQVFVLSRIKEEYNRTGDLESAIAVGLGKSGPIITSAAVLIAIVFISMGAFSSTWVGKSLGFGLGIVVLLDAFAIRGTLVPALLRLAGRHVWWEPGWLARLRRRAGLVEG